MEEDTEAICCACRCAFSTKALRIVRYRHGRRAPYAWICETCAYNVLHAHTLAEERRK